MTNQTQLFEAALGIKAPWYVQGVDFGAELTIAVDFVAGSRFAYPGVPGEHPVHDTVIKRLRHLNFFQFDCFLEVRACRVCACQTARCGSCSLSGWASLTALRCCLKRSC